MPLINVCLLLYLCLSHVRGSQACVTQACCVLTCALVAALLFPFKAAALAASTVSKDPSRQQYTILLLITDGAICDMEK